VPGNHDWYDGLTAFLRVFAQQRRIGGWRTVQRRSYFVAELPHGWWLVGLDTQLGTEIDDPQRLFFEQHLSARLSRGDSVIVCSAAPTWVCAQQRDPDAFNTLHWFDRHVVRNRISRESEHSEPTVASIRLWLTGDLVVVLLPWAGGWPDWLVLGLGLMFTGFVTGGGGNPPGRVRVEPVGGFPVPRLGEAPVVLERTPSG
jgi:hypothetical protein